MPKTLAVCLSATIQRTVTFRALETGCVNRAERYREDASGKAVNAARVLNQIEEGSAAVVCPLGEKNAERFMELSRRDGMEVHAVTAPGLTRECWTLLDRMRGTTTELVVGEADSDREFPDQERALLSKIESLLPSVDAVLLAGSCPRVWSDGLMACVARMAVDSGKILLADCHGDDLSRVMAACVPSIIKINRDEFCETFDLNPHIDSDSLSCAVARESESLGNIVAVTCGTRPTIAARGGRLEIFPAEKIRAVNTTACGDSFSAGFLSEYLATRDFKLSLAKGTWCAARNAERECPGSIR